MDKLVKLCMSATDSIAAAIDPHWKETVKRLGLPQSHDQLSTYLARSSRLLGEVQTYRWHPGPGKGKDKGHWHLFAPSQEDCKSTPCPGCEDRPGRPAWRDCPEHQEKCPDCGFLRRDAFELPFISPELHARAKLTTVEGCKDATVRGAWGERDHWLGKPKGAVHEPQFEVWDGERWRDDSAFFDPQSSFLLPLKCEECCKTRSVYCAQNFRPPWFTRPTPEMWCAERKRFEARCPICKGAIVATLEELQRRGDPRNLKLGLHLDGFPAATTSNKSSCIMDLFPMTVSKLTLHKGAEDWLWPVMYPQKMQIVAGPDSYDAFMLVLVLDALRLFIDGVEIDYALLPEEISPHLPPRRGPVKIRMMVSSVFSDLPALADMLKFKLGGFHASRSCKHVGGYVDGKLVYTDGRRLARDGCEPKKMDEVAAAMLEHLGAETKAERTEIGHRTGVIGFSMLLILSAAFCLHLVHDVCSDFLHCGPENLCKHLVRDLLYGVSRKQGETTTIVEPPRADLKEFGKRLAGIKPTRKLASGRWPADPAKRPLGWWKADEHMKAATVCFVTAFAGITDPEAYAVVQLVACIHTLVFVVGTRGGWTAELAHLFRQLCRAKLVRAEEDALPKLRPLEHETCLHMPANVRMHGPPDAYWCYAQERYIRKLVNTPNNGKQIETTLHGRTLAALTVGWLQRRRREEQLRAAGRTTGDESWERARARVADGVLFAASQQEARGYLTVLEREPPRDGRPSDERLLASMRTEGVAIGQLPENWERRSFMRLENPQRLAVEKILDKEARGAGQNGVRTVRLEAGTVKRVKSIQLGENNFAVGDFAVLRPEAAGGLDEYVLVDSFFTAKPLNGPRRVFVQFSAFQTQKDGVTGEPLGGSHHNCLMLDPLEQDQERVRLARDLHRHFVPYPTPGETVFTGSSHVIEVAQSGFGFDAHDVWVPVYPRVGDVVRLAVREPPEVRQEGVEGQWGYGVPYDILKSVRPDFSLSYALVKQVSSGQGRMAVVQWLRRSEPAASDGEESDWTLWPIAGRTAMDVDDVSGSELSESEDESAGEFELKRVTWNSIIDVVEAVTTVEDEKGTVFRFKTLPPETGTGNGTESGTESDAGSETGPKRSRKLNQNRKWHGNWKRNGEATEEVGKTGGKIGPRPSVHCLPLLDVPARAGPHLEWTSFHKKGIGLPIERTEALPWRPEDWVRADNMETGSEYERAFPAEQAADPGNDAWDSESDGDVFE
ncbi:hypothetical protein KFL_004030040 [Klebsormidium nitens]|uniref:Uncharacterized protein n=1 Tax=Klebsormidium nitens TaxID=105231 RepID=A0A1Y1IAZ0_KLENI|nr:hypothetical protein KFL_004030040 [Klebsormidium nitens]|eukprot:GAQ88134.1 hypothetical protein KFL_004030040 [Klebsormidium nitens]